MHQQQAEMARQGEVIQKTLEATGEVVRLEDALHSNLRALAGAQHFEETVMSLSAAIQLLTVRLGQPMTPATREESKETQGRAA